MSVCVLRHATASDMNFIYHSWLKSGRKDFSMLDSDAYYAQQKAIIEPLINRSTITIAADPTEPALHIYGYLVSESTSEGSLIHFSYVKDKFRNFGIFGQLLKNLKTPVYADFMRPRDQALYKKFNIKFKPELKEVTT